MPIVSPFLKSRLTNKNLLAFTVKDEEEGGLNQRMIWRRKDGFKKYFVQMLRNCGRHLSPRFF